MMQRSEPVSVELLALHDVAAAFELTRDAGWNQTEADWRRILDLEPRGAFGAFDNGTLVGTTTSLTYGSDLAWIGMVFVSESYRRRGIGRQLMEATLRYLNHAGVASIKLDATPVGRPLYESLGFVPETSIERWEGTATLVAQDGLQELNDSLRKAVYSLDLTAFGADRTRVIRRLFDDSCTHPLVAPTSDGKPRGYALARSGYRASYIGPLVAVDSTSALELFDGMLAALAGAAVYIDFNRDCSVSSDELVTRGFTKQRDLLRMRYGSPSSAGTSKLIFAIAGPELG